MSMSYAMLFPLVGYTCLQFHVLCYILYLTLPVEAVLSFSNYGKLATGPFNCSHCRSLNSVASARLYFHDDEYNLLTHTCH